MLQETRLSGTVPFKEGTVPCLQPQGGFFREQEGFCLPFKAAWREHWVQHFAKLMIVSQVLFGSCLIRKVWPHVSMVTIIQYLSGLGPQFMVTVEVNDQR